MKENINESNFDNKFYEQQKAEEKLAISLLPPNDYDNIILLSLLSLIFKRIKNNDILVQLLEVEFLRKNAYKINSFQDLLECLNLDENKDQFQIFEIIINNILQTKPTNAQELIKNIEISIKNNLFLINDNTSLQQQILMPKQNDKTYTLTPTQGIAMLNNNPYSFFVNKILKLKPIDEWQNKIDARFHGQIIHEIMEGFTANCKIFTKIDKNLKQDLQSTFDKTLVDIVLNKKLKINAFLQKKLSLIKNIAVDLELKRILADRIVLTEKAYSTIIDNVKIYACADRIEIDDKKKEIYIFDYKSGNVPTNSQEINGEKTQLLIIAMLILKQYQYQNYKIKRMCYIDLSGKEKTQNEEIDINEIDNTEQNLKQMIDNYFDNQGQPIIEKLKYIKPKTNLLYQNDKLLMQLIRQPFII